MKRTIQEKIFYYTRPRLFLRKINELRTAEERVIWLLKHNEHLRNCDKCLIFHYNFRVDGLRGNITKAKIHALTPQETITRCRRMIQNELGLYIPTDNDVIQARGISQEAVRAWSIISKQLED